MLVSSAKIIGADVHLLSWVSHFYIEEKVEVQIRSLVGLISNFGPLETLLLLSLSLYIAVLKYLLSI